MRTRLKELILKIGYAVFKTVRAPIKWYWKKFNVRTYGVRLLIVCNGSLILVRHWYNNLWVMPGGGIKKGETPEQAALREAKEELGLDLSQLEYLLGAYSNNKEGKNDTVYCYVVELTEEPLISRGFNFEISDILWKPFDQLPEGTSSATRSRIQEYLNQDISDEIRPWS